MSADIRICQSYNDDYDDNKQDFKFQWPLNFCLD